MEADPSETRDLAASHLGIVMRMNAMFEAWKKRMRVTNDGSRSGF